MWLPTAAIAGVLAKHDVSLSLEFLGPLIFLNKTERYTLALGLRHFQQQPSSDSQPVEHLLMAATLLMTAPIIALFFLAQRYLVRGIVMTGIKG